MRSLARSILALLNGVISKFIFWLPFILLDISDYWEKYVRPGLQHFTGRDVVMPSGTLLGFAAFGILWSGILTYHELRIKKLEQDEELAPNVEIDPNPILQEWLTAGKLCRCFYLTIRNPSAKPLHNVCVYLTDISPHVPDLDWLPIPLHIKHDNEAPHHEYFHMNPRGMRHVDLVSHEFAQPNLTLEHIVPGVNKYAPLGTYILTVRVEGSSIASPSTAKFLVKLDHLGNVICLPAAYTDLDKGLLEFNYDAKMALERITPTISTIAKTTERIGHVATALTKAVESALRTPIKWYERIVRINTIADRLRWSSPLWAKRLSRVAEDLKQATALYVAQADAVILNMTGYAELTTSVSVSDFNLIKQFQDNMTKALESTKAFRASVLTNQTMRMTTDITRSMKFMGSVLDAQIEATERMSDTLGLVVTLVEQKVDKP